MYLDGWQVCRLGWYLITHQPVWLEIPFQLACPAAVAVALHTNCPLHQNDICFLANACLIMGHAEQRNDTVLVHCNPDEHAMA